MLRKMLPLILSSLWLASCTQQKTPSSHHQAPSSSSSSAMSQTSKQRSSTTETASKTVIESQQPTDSQTQIEQPTTNEQNYAETLRLVAADTTPGRATHYAFYDVDVNGTAELITASGTGDHLYLAAIYYLKNGVSTYLAQSYVASAGGYRSGFVIYTDGFIEVDEWLSGSGLGTSSLYQLAPDNSGYAVVSKLEFNMRESGNPDPVHFSDGRVALTVEDFTWIAF